MKPTYYYWIIYDINNQLNKATRRYIYDIMAESSVLDIPKKVCDTMFNIHRFAQMNDSRAITPYNNIYKEYQGVKCILYDDDMKSVVDDPSINLDTAGWSKFSQWDMSIKFQPITLSSLYNEHIDSTTQLMKSKELIHLYNQLRTDGIQRNGYSYYFLDGPYVEGENPYKYSNNSQSIIFIFS